METRKRHPKNFSFCAGISISKYDTVLINVSLFSVMVSICCKEKLIGSLVLTMLTFQYVNNTQNVLKNHAGLAIWWYQIPFQEIISPQKAGQASSTRQLLRSTPNIQLDHCWWLPTYNCCIFMLHITVASLCLSCNAGNCRASSVLCLVRTLFAPLPQQLAKNFLEPYKLEYRKEFLSQTI